MEVSFCSQNTARINHPMPQQKKDSSKTTATVAAGGTGYVTAKTISKYPATINKLSTILKNTQIFKLEKQKQILSLLSGCKRLSKYANNPLVKGSAAFLALACSLPMFFTSFLALANAADGNFKQAA